MVQVHCFNVNIKKSAPQKEMCHLVFIIWTLGCYKVSAVNSVIVRRFEFVLFVGCSWLWVLNECPTFRVVFLQHRRNTQELLCLSSVSLPHNSLTNH